MPQVNHVIRTLEFAGYRAQTELPLDSQIIDFLPYPGRHEIFYRTLEHGDSLCPVELRVVAIDEPFEEDWNLVTVGIDEHETTFFLLWRWL